MDDYIHFKTETNDNINDLNKNLNFDDKKVNNDKYILEKNKNILEKINSNNLHRKLALRNLIDKNDKYKDLYFLIYPMNKRKNEEKTINNKINLNLGIDLFKMRFKNSNNYLKNDNVIKWFKEMKITEEERMNSDNIRLTNLINENNNDSILNKNN